VVVMQVSGG